jgi:hypothetical protein
VEGGTPSQSNVSAPAFAPDGKKFTLAPPSETTSADGTVIKASPPAVAPVIRFGPDGRSYYGSAHGITAAGADLKSAVIADGIAVRDFVVAHNGLIYATEAGNVWLVRPDGAKQVADSGLHSATGVTLSPDQSLLYVADGATHWIYSYQVQPDGTLADKQRYYWLHVADTEDQQAMPAECAATRRAGSMSRPTSGSRSATRRAA